MRIEITNKKFWIIIIVLSIIAIANLANFFIESDYLKSNLYGIYLGNDDIIKVKTNRSIMDIQETFYHELGHHVWFKILNDTERELYKSIIPMDRLHGGSVKEDFASWFKIYAMNQCGNKIRCDFIENTIDKHNIELFYYKQKRIGGFTLTPSNEGN